MKKISKSKTIWKFINLFALIFGLIASILAILLLPMPWFDNHNIWNDLFEGKVDVTPLRSDTGGFSFQIINNHPYMIEGVKVSSNFDCGNTNKNNTFFLKSELKMIPSGQGDIFYFSDIESLDIINSSTNNILKYGVNITDYLVSYKTKNKNLYAINLNGKISKYNFSSNFSFYNKVCEVETTLNYNYNRFGKNIQKSQVISDLGATLVSRATSHGSNQVGSGGSGSSFRELCKSKCEECAKYPDWNEATGKGTVGNQHLCQYWFCLEIKKQYPNDIISCLSELYGVCLWHKVIANETLKICVDFGSKLKTECMWYENDECHMSGMLWE